MIKSPGRQGESTQTRRDDDGPVGVIRGTLESVGA